MEKKKYVAAVTGWILGEHRRKGTVILASDEEAKYALLDGTILLALEPEEKSDEVKPAKAKA